MLAGIDSLHSQPYTGEKGGEVLEGRGDVVNNSCDV